MVAAYLAGATAEEAASQFGYSYMACIFVLKQRGIKPRGRSEARRVYAVDETFFNVINTEEKAYWLGLLCKRRIYLISTSSQPLFAPIIPSSSGNKLKKARCIVSGKFASPPKV
jgi:hypothetical protein